MHRPRRRRRKRRPRSGWWAPCRCLIPNLNATYPALSGRIPLLGKRHRRTPPGVHQLMRRRCRFPKSVARTPQTLTPGGFSANLPDTYGPKTVSNPFCRRFQNVIRHTRRRQKLRVRRSGQNEAQLTLIKNPRQSRSEVHLVFGGPIDPVFVRNDLRDEQKYILARTCTSNGLGIISSN